VSSGDPRPPRGRHPDLLEAIPARFRTPGFAEGDEIEKQLVIERQRSVSLRPAALKHYGCHCQFPECEVTEQYKLDVHHLNPISNGTRVTRIEDVTVLCKNHHAEAHHLLKSS
jgi:predicted HNH restriction endonuclease